MDKQQEIVQMLWDESFNSKQMRCNFVKSDDFEDLAEKIVKLFAIPDVVEPKGKFYCKKGTCTEEEQCNHCWNEEHPFNQVMQ